ncbi:sugar ABC transporter permease [bacterium D16-76]|nr:sugar ABC transporter permease [bacterium D16-76]
MKKTKAYWLFLLPSLLGVLLFYTIPFLFSLYYALVDNMGSQSFVGLRNFTDTLQNSLFQSAAVNTAVFVGLSVPLSMALSLFLSLCLQGMKRGRVLATMLLLLPLVVPSGTIVYFWKVLFDSNGLLQKMLLQLGFNHEAVAQNGWAMGVLVAVFLWKNVSYNIVLFWSGLNWIPKTYYEQMALEGAGKWKQFTNVTWIYLSPTTFVVLLMSIVNSFKVFKEVYMLYGAYPSPDIYMLQHYMNNQFLSLNMQKLSSAAYILFLVIGIVLLIVFYAQKRVTDAYQ